MITFLNSTKLPDTGTPIKFTLVHLVVEGTWHKRKQGRAEVADKMLKAGIDIQQIAELTQLSVEEVEALKA